jgi:phosphoesterase RecJ-like protein
VPADEDVLVYLDGSDCTRYGRAFDLALINNRPTICIDHHVTNDHFARINWVDTRAAAVAELIFELLARLQIQVATQAVIASEAKQSPPSHAEIASSQKTLLAMTGAEQLLDENIAQCLLTGIVTDTLVFRTTSTTALTLEIAAQLIRAGGSIVEIVDHAYMRRSLKSLRLFGRVMSTAQIEDAIIWGEVSYATIRELGLNKNGTSGLVNQLLTVAEANIAFLLVEQENGKIDLNLRARPGLDISAVALALGGGGHPQAAGAMLEGPLDAARTRVLNEIKRSLGRQYA